MNHCILNILIRVLLACPVAFFAGLLLEGGAAAWQVWALVFVAIFMGIAAPDLQRSAQTRHTEQDRRAQELLVQLRRERAELQRLHFEAELEYQKATAFKTALRDRLFAEHP